MSLNSWSDELKINFLSFYVELVDEKGIEMEVEVAGNVKMKFIFSLQLNYEQNCVAEKSSTLAQLVRQYFTCYALKMSQNARTWNLNR